MIDDLPPGRMTPLDLLTQLNELDEHSRIEAKTASEVGKSFLETVCAFANEPGLGGGWIVLGAKLDESSLFRQYLVTGLSDPDKIQRDLVSQCASAFNRPIRVQVESGLVNGKNVLSVFVPEAAPGEKPIHLEGRPLPASAFRRQGSSDVHCTEDDLAVFYQDRRGESYDATIVRDADLSALDPAAIAEYRRLRAATKPGAEELGWADTDLLYALRCASSDNGVLRPTVAGLLLFGTGPALRRYFPLMRIDYIRIPGREWIQDPERRFETLEIRAPLLTLARKAHAAILDDLPKAFSLPAGQIHREEIPLIPDRVIREAVVNALMHRSYRIQGAIQILRYANRLEIRNPGHSLVADDRLGEPGSETRNPTLASVLHEANLAETKGSGIRVMRQLMEQVNLTPPTFLSDRTRNQFVVTCLFHHFLSPEDWTWLHGLGVPDLASEEARALVYAREMEAIDNATYRHLNQVDVLNASQHLRRLRDRGLLAQKGKGADTYYTPAPRLMTSWTGPSLGDIVSPENLPSSLPTGQAIQVVSQAVQIGAKPVQLIDESIQVPGVANPIGSLPHTLQEQIRSLGARPKTERLRETLVALCRWKPLTGGELAELLGRNRVYLVNDHLGPLVEDGILVHGMPDHPRHPYQTYQVPQEEGGKA